MKDHSNWALVDDFTVEQAACLWAGIDPQIFDSHRWNRRHPVHSTVAPFLQMLSGAVQSGGLPVDHRPNALSIIGEYAKSVVTRGSLMAFAASKNQRPAFLFETKLPAEQAPQRPAAPAKVQDPESAVAPVDRAAPRRLPQAPPPPPTLRGGFVPAKQQDEPRPTEVAGAPPPATAGGNGPPKARVGRRKELRNRLVKTLRDHPELLLEKREVAVATLKGLGVRVSVKTLRRAIAEMGG